MVYIGTSLLGLKQGDFGTFGILTEKTGLGHTVTWTHCALCPHGTAPPAHRHPWDTQAASCPNVRPFHRGCRGKGSSSIVVLGGCPSDITAWGFVIAAVVLIYFLTFLF